MSVKRFWMGCGLGLSILVVSSCGGSSTQVQPPAPVPPPPVSPAPPVSLSFQGLDGFIVHQLYQHSGVLVAASDNGVYRRNNSGSWIAAGLVGYDIMALGLLTEQHWLASSYQRDQDGYPVYLLFESFNAGSDWHQVNYQFGQAGENEAIYAMLFDEVAQVVYATGIQVLASSADMGQSWKVVHGDFGGFGQPKTALTQAADGQTIWYGGQGAIEDGILYQVDLATRQGAIHTGLFPNPSSIQAIRYAPDDPQTVYVSSEGGIVRSTDHGQSWQTILGDVDYRFYFDLVIDPNAPNRIFTAGWKKEFSDPQPLIIEWTENGGQSWQQYEYPESNFFGGVRSMMLVEENQQQVIYFGLYKGGIMRMPLP
ncbi:hypothetical protein WG68_08335 [Arsukibacterium ikkense]|uniref:Sortilin N-terminal domain-containing protein n=1 Tax=Arsukibacterium ikkense TaxID=336831 RepID=A0A0M2V506_9GAMM|nr:hypothetical protein [Arsukibacterium ikkense]KKO45716.1 hypothetical protein WG68_08335 [Arsukibacterium ikkense]